MSGQSLNAAFFRGGSGEPLLLVHGAQTSWHVWAPVLDLLTPDFEVFAPTLPGHRGGPPLPGPVGVQMFADWVETYLDEQGLATAHVAGNSLGGIVALELVRRGRARSAVNFGGPSSGSREAFDRFHARSVAAARLGRVPGLMPAVVGLAARSAWLRRRMLTGGVVRGDRMTRTDFETIMADGAYADVGLHLVPWLLDGHELQPFSVGDVPVLVAWGAEDGAVSLEEFGRPTQQLAGGAELTVLEGAAHMPMFDVPDVVVAAIRTTAARVLR